MQKEHSVHDIPLLRTAELDSGARVLLRVDFNVPVADGVVQDDYRIERALPTIRSLQERGCKVVLISHIENDVGSTLEPVSRALQHHVDHTYVPSLEKENVEAAIEKLEPGEVVLLGNVREDPREKENVAAFAKKLASYADVYINDAFSVSHREHATVVGIPAFLPSFAGLLLEKEISKLSDILEDPSRPFIFILGGAKFGTKLPLIEKFLDRADAVHVGGALANDIYRSRGLEVGNSRFSNDVDVSHIVSHHKLVVADTVVVETSDGESQERSITEIFSRDRILDMAPPSVERVIKEAHSAKLVVWNGPLGDYEHGYGEGTETLASGLADCAKEGVEVVIGGGDTLAVIGNIGLQDAYSFVSTGGGALLEFLSQETLPGIKALARHS